MQLRHEKLDVGLRVSQMCEGLYVVLWDRREAVPYVFVWVFFLTLFTIYDLSPEYQYMHSFIAKSFLIM